MKNTKKALLLSVMSLMLCVSMLVGTTFAWFTDSVSTGKNIIAAGNLDIELEYSKDFSNWASVEGQTDLVDPNAKWEPGHTEVVYLRISNKGSLALKYAFNMTVANSVVGKSVLGNDIFLADYLEYDIVEVAAKYETREKARKAVENTAETLSAYKVDGSMKAGDPDKTLALVVYMPEEVDNHANYRGEEIPTIDLGLRLFATQLMSEEDSFDETYDEDTAVFTVAEANAMILENKDVTLVNCIEPNGIIEVPAAYSGKLILKDSTIQSVQADGDVSITILGNVVVDATGNGIATLSVANFDGTAVSSAGKLTLNGTGHLTAIAADMKGAFGIGGMNAKEITIEGITVDYAAGSYAYGVGSDTKYYKDAPEGGAAIGSNVNGAVITLNDVNIVKAIGGSKAAGIGARYHVGVTVNINDSTIGYVEGGVSAAGIGGSRVSDGASENGTTINISKSTVTAVGGAYGAGIGSGYDTHCQSNQPLCTIYITDSVINATGGRYASGVGTGYHNAALTGEIKNTQITAASGEKYYKDSYTAAMDIGFGVVDPVREGTQTDSKLICNGKEITLATAPDAVTNAEQLTEALAKGSDVVLAEDVKTEAATTAPYGNKYAFKQDGGVLDGNGNELYMECYGDDYGIMTSGGTIKNVTIQEGCRAVMIMYPTEDIIIDNVNIGGDGVLYPINTGEAGSDGVDLVVTNSVLAGWTSYGNIESASFTNVAFEQGTYYNDIYGRVLKPYVGTTMTDCSFVAHMNLDLSNLAQGQKIVMKNCTVDGQALTAAVMVVPTTDSQYDTELFTVDLPSWAGSIADCIVFE